MVSDNDTQSAYSIHELPDGRNLGYAVYGRMSGFPVLFFHGAPGSSYIHEDIADAAAQLNVRLIAVDRPSYGASSPHAQRTMASVADDVNVLMDALCINRYSLVGFSGGSPYSLACAARYPERVLKVAQVATLAPLDAPGISDSLPPMVQGLYALARSNPEELRKTFSAVAATPTVLFQTMAASASEWDKRLLLERQPEFEAEYARALQQGVEGVAQDFVLASGDWGFEPASITAEVHLWLGTADQNTPPAMSHYIEQQVRNSHMHVLEGEGHFVLYPHWRQILAKIIF